MRLNEAREIIDCLPKGKTRFYYFKDRYALLLLSLAAEEHRSKKELRSSRFARLLDKEVVREALSQSRGSELAAEDVDAVWPVRYECYFLTLAIWGSNRRDVYYQTSRNGFNIVLQLNFSSEHDDPYRRLVDPSDRRPFEYGGHPIATGQFHTLAWARLDIDLANEQALIEEIQNDWIRKALRARRVAARQRGPRYRWGSKVNNNRVIRYVDNNLKRHEAIWHEAMLSAAIWFLRCELGVRKIYYHTHESGARLKSIEYRLPPRSLYTRLPRRFCFAETDEVPGLLAASTRSRVRRERLEQARFFEMRL